MKNNYFRRGLDYFRNPFGKEKGLEKEINKDRMSFRKKLGIGLLTFATMFSQPCCVNENEPINERGGYVETYVGGNDDAGEDTEYTTTTTTINSTTGPGSTSTTVTDLDGDGCPDDMAYIPGGKIKVIHAGQRWGNNGEWGIQTEWVNIESFCIDQYEASQPDATSTFRGSWTWGFNPGMHMNEPPISFSRPGVLPWVNIAWSQARVACEKAGKKLPSLAEWQMAFSGNDGQKFPNSGEYDLGGVSTWTDDSCYVEREYGIYPTGGCGFIVCNSDTQECSSKKVYDLVGNVAEWIEDPWDPNCYENSQFALAGGASHMFWGSANNQREDPLGSGCWTKDTYSVDRSSIHNHGNEPYYDDDGFRCAADPYVKE